jgi:type VI secretion system protein ImpM
MELIDPWLQAAVAQSRNDMGDAWLQTYLASPIWRFWLGNRVAGRSVLGALMPSVDGVGRYFPLICVGGFEDSIAPPDIDPQDEWFETLEGHMLAALADDATFEGLIEAVGTMDPPEVPMALMPEGNLKALFAQIRFDNADVFYGDFSYWWIPPGPDGLKPRAIVRRGLPSPRDYGAMLAVELGDQARSAAGGS